MLKELPEYHFDIAQLTCRNTHGDYFISQLICGENSINAVIDWTTACVHPVIWEIIRSYVYAAPECAGGSIDIAKLVDYVNEYCREAPLNACDIRNIAPLFRYQLAVCDYYGQYYASQAANRHIYLHQAEFSTGLLKWFDAHIDELTQALCDGVKYNEKG